MRLQGVFSYFVFALCYAYVSARITHRHILADQRDHYLVELPFGFDETGHIEIQVKNVQIYAVDETKQVDMSQFGFFLASPVLGSQVENSYNKGYCLLKDEHIVKLFDFTELNAEMKSAKTKLVFEDQRLKPGEYALYYADCDSDAALTYDVRIAMYNVDADGQRDYLSVGERPLPAIYMVYLSLVTWISTHAVYMQMMFLVFSVLAMWWAKACYTERNHVHGIHYLMFGLVVLRAVVYFTMAGMYHDDRVTGSPEGWNVAYYVFTFLRGVMFFVVIVLIGTGWSYLRPFIGENEKKVLVVVIPLQVFANIAIIILDETSPARTTFVTLTDLFHLVDIICCCAILFPIVWSIKHLREGAESDGKAAANVEKLTLFRQFYVLVVVYIYFTRIIVFFLESTLQYDYKWTSKLARELATLALYVTVGVKFRPHGENKYLKLDSEASA